MSDILSSFSLLFAALALFYSVWYDRIMNFIDNWNPPSKYRKTEHDNYLKKAKRIKKYRLFPLLLGSFFISLLLFFEVIRLLIDVIAISVKEGLQIITKFNTVKAVIVILFVFAALLFIHLFKIYIELSNKIKSNSE
jgi:hypothetical protein